MLPLRSHGLGILLAVSVALTYAATAQNVEPPEETLQATNVLPADILKGPLHTVEPAVVNNGLLNRITVVSDYGNFVAESHDMARIRISEIAALDRLQELKQSKAFAGGARESVLKRWRAVKTLATHPVRTAKRLPRGTARYFGNFYRMAQGGRGELEESAGKELIRYSSAVRGVAAYVNADPYTSNPILQRELRDTARSAYAGGLVVEGGLFFIPANDVSTVLQMTTTSVGMSQAIESESPESLRAVNKRKLKDMGLDRPLIRAFLKHPWYSPRHETILIESLRRMDGVADRGAFLQLALQAASEQDALYYQRAAEMLAGYHEHVEPFQRLFTAEGLPFGLTASGKRICALPVDYLRWTEANARQADALESDPALQETSEGPSELWLTGEASPSARQQLQSRNITLHPNAADALHLDPITLPTDSPPES